MTTIGKLVKEAGKDPLQGCGECRDAPAGSVSVGSRGSGTDLLLSLLW